MSNDVICVANAILSRRSNGRDALLETPILCISEGFLRRSKLAPAFQIKIANERSDVQSISAWRADRNRDEVH